MAAGAGDQTGGKGHYPRQAQIDHYGDGGFRFADMSHKGSILCLPTGMWAWSVTQVGEVSADSLGPLLAPDLGIDVALIGMGADIAPLPVDVRDRFRGAGIIVEALATGSALRTYNVLMAENRAVAAALIAVERHRAPK